MASRNSLSRSSTLPFGTFPAREREEDLTKACTSAHNVPTNYCTCKAHWRQWGSRLHGSQQAHYIISLVLWQHDSCVVTKQSLLICENWPISAQSELTSASCSPSSFKYLLAAIWSGQMWARCQDYCRCMPLWTWGRDKVGGVAGTPHKQPIHEVT